MTQAALPLVRRQASGVRILPQRGAHITQLSAKEVNDLFEVRRSLIGLLARKICPAQPTLVRALAGAMAVLISLLTVSFQAIRAALANPVKSLRSE